MRKVLILANNASDLYNMRFELINEIIRQNYILYFVVPQSIEDKKVQLIIDVGAKYIQTPMNRRGTNPFEDTKLLFKYYRIIKEVNPDVILTFSIKPNIYGTYAASIINKPVIMNITGMGSSMTNNTSLKKLIKQMYKWACKKAQVIFFQNEHNRDFFTKNNMVNMQKTILIPGSGVNISKFTPMKKTTKDNVTRFLFIGRIMKEKGIEEYLEVAERITRKFNNVEFQILGRFEEQRYKRIIQNNKNNRIRYLGISDDVREEIKEVDCIVHPSYHEGMSNVLLEGAAMGKPLIASDIPGCREIIEDGHNGYLFEVKSVKSLEEKLVQFISLDDDTRELMGKNSRNKVVKEFDRKIIIDEYMKAINNVLKEGY